MSDIRADMEEAKRGFYARYKGALWATGFFVPAAAASSVCFSPYFAAPLWFFAAGASLGVGNGIVKKSFSEMTRGAFKGAVAALLIGFGTKYLVKPNLDPEIVPQNVVGQVQDACWFRGSVFSYETYGLGGKEYEVKATKNPGFFRITFPYKDAMTGAARIGREEVYSSYRPNQADCILWGVPSAP
ncbi:MAG: hypothetical protein KGI97_03655 [Alphaproteobacteria bacterium]|nr:hypothetical protein [Alphaproteobacteria bacterium]